MKQADFIAKLKLAHDVPNYYNNHFPYNCGYFDGQRYSFDCWNLIKCILAQPSWEPTGIAGYYVPPRTFVTGDCDGYHLLMQCTERSKDFSKLHQPGTYLYISTSPHAGVYIGDFEYQGETFNVVECTGAWDSKVQYTYVDEKGDRYLYKNGPKNKYSWTDYGLLPWVEYDKEPVPVPNQWLGIDVSVYQHDIDWTKVSKQIDFCIAKAGGSEAGRFKDSTFERNYAYAKANGVKIGCYFMGGKGFTSAAAGKADADFFLQLISGKNFDYPCFIDLELPGRDTRQGNTDACIAFCEAVKAAGYRTGIYASDISGFKDRLDLSRLNGYDKWVARYGAAPQIVSNFQIWQYTSSGSVDGINGRVDMDISYKDYSGNVPESYYYMGVDFSPVFDPDYYANRYPDLEGAFGYDHVALWNHFTTFGMYEFRQASAEFNPKVYQGRYEDLRNAFGDNRPLYYWHYCYFGKNEGRSAI